VFVTATQVLWLRAVKHCSGIVLSIGMNANFIMTVAWGVLLLRQYPTPAEAAGASSIAVLIVVQCQCSVYSLSFIVVHRRRVIHPCQHHQRCG
jgi:drug/metabolite transporter (DMT)-like permease